MIILYHQIITLRLLPFVILKRLGDNTAGHKNRRYKDAEIRWSLISSFPAVRKAWIKLNITLARIPSNY